LRLAKLVPRGKFRSFLSSAESNLGKHLDGNNVDRAPVQRAFNRDALSQVAFRPILRIEREDLPGRIVIQREARALSGTDWFACDLKALLGSTMVRNTPAMFQSASKTGDFTL
jgi:hypothetical protein